MNRLLFITAIFIGTLISCSEEKIPEQIEAEKKDETPTSYYETVNDSLSLIKLWSETYVMGDYHIIIREVDSTKIESSFEHHWTNSDSTQVLASDQVIRSKDSLTFNLKSDEQLHLNNIPYNDDESNIDEVTDYLFIQSMKPNNFWEIQAYAYEFSYVIYANQLTGALTKTIGNGLFSPTGKLLFVSNVDLGAEYTPTGIELYEVEDNVIKKVGITEFNNWGIYDLNWLSNSKLSATKTHRREDYSFYDTKIEIDIVKQN